MGKKSNVNIPLIAVIRVIVFLIIGVIGFVGYSKAQDFLTRDPMFALKEIYVEKTIEFIDKKPLLALKGTNIFTVDIAKMHKRIQTQYPQISQLHIVKELPNNLKILAKKRNAAIALALKGKYLLVDNDAVPMYVVEKPEPLPVVLGGFNRKKIVLGAPLTYPSVMDALKIVQALALHPHIAGLKLTSIDLENVSRYVLVFRGGFQVLIEKENLAGKLDMLETLLAQRKIDFNTAKYVDLRFNEPVLGENVP